MKPVCLAVVLGLSLSATSAWALDDQQQAIHTQAQSALKAALADIASAQSSAGTADNPAKGSRLRLTQTRLASAKQKLEQAATSLGKLPADDDAVKPTLEAYKQAVKTADQITAIIQPPATEEAKADANENKDNDTNAATKQTDAKQTDAKAASPKLDYKQEEQLRNARFNLREAVNGINKSAAVVKAMDESASSVVHAQVTSALATLAQAQTKLQYAQDALKTLPAAHDAVAPILKEASDAANTLAATASRLQAAEKQLGQAASVGNYPRYAQDLALLQELARRYSQFDEASQRPELMAQIIREDGAALQEIKRIAQTYLPLVEQKTAEGQQMEKVFNYFQSKRGEFSQQFGQYQQALPAAFQKDLDQVQALALQAVNERKPAFFAPEGGIAQHLAFAREKLHVIESLGKEAAAPYIAKLNAAQADIQAKGKALEQDIIHSNTLPADRYTTDDRDALIAIAKDAWSHQQKDAKILKVVIPAESWKRDTRWQWHRDAFVKIDASRLQVQLVIQHNDKLAVVQPINMIKNHMQSDAVIGSPLRSGNETPPPQAFILLEKVK